MRGHEVALWSGVAAFFGSLLAVGIFDALNPSQAWQYLGALIVAFVTAGSVYAKQRLDEAKKAEGIHGDTSTTK
jgi:hypothetical protein